MSRTDRAEPSEGAEERFDVVHARLLRFYPELVRELGGDPRALAGRVGLDFDLLAADQSGSGYREQALLLELAASELGVSDFGLRLASLQSGEILGPISLVMKNSRTFGEALAYVGGHTPAHSLAARIWRAPEEGGVFSGHDILVEGVPNKAQAMEQILLLGHLGAMESTGGQARARRIHFRHHPVSPLKTYRRYFGCEVLFGQNEDGVYFSDRDLASPIIHPNSQVYESATSFIDSQFSGRQPPLRALARGVIMQFLGSEDCRNERVAAELNLHPKTMNRRLKAEGASFQKIKDEVRRDLMLYYLQNTSLDFAHISERLGFAEQSVMTRNCNRWFGASPTRVRAQGRSRASA